MLVRYLSLLFDASRTPVSRRRAIDTNSLRPEKRASAGTHAQTDEQVANVMLPPRIVEAAAGTRREAMISAAQ